MRPKNNYLVLTYTSLPDTDFLCDYKGDIRIKISAIKEPRPLRPLEAKIYAFGDGCMFFVEDIGSKLKSMADLKAAMEWYKTYLKSIKSGYKPANSSRTGTDSDNL